MKIYKDGELYVEITSPDELLGMYQTIANNLRNNYFSNVEVMRLIASARSIYQVATMPSEPTINTVYYVGTEAPYDVKLVDSNGTVVPLGNSDADFSNFYTKTECDYRFLDKQNFLNHIFPKGSIFTTYENKNPSTFLGGTWVLIGGQDANLNYYPAFAIATDTEGTTISESAPNVKASYRPGGNWPITNLRTDLTNGQSTTVSGAFSITQEETSLMISSTSGTAVKPKVLNFDASNSNPIYQDNAHVNVNAIKIFFWRRTDDAPIVYNTGNITMDTELDENATDDHIPTSKAVVDYVNEHGSQIVETVLWQSPNGTSGTSFSGNNDITLTDKLMNYDLFEVVYVRSASASNGTLFFSKKDLEERLGLTMNFTAEMSYDEKNSYVNIGCPSTLDTNVLTIRSSVSCNLCKIVGYKSIPMINTYSREIRELIMNTPVSSTTTDTASITLTKGMSNYDYLEIYFDIGSSDNTHDFRRVSVSDLINIYNSSASRIYEGIFDLDSSRRWCKYYRVNDTTMSIQGAVIRITQIYGVKAEPVVVGDKPYKQLYFNQAGVSSGNITLNDDMSKFSYLEIFTRCAQFCQSMKVSVQQLLNNTSNTKPISNSAWDNGVTRYVYLTRTSNTTFSASTDPGSTPTKVYEIIGWY